MRYPTVWVVSLASITNRGLPKWSFSRNYKIRVVGDQTHYTNLLITAKYRFLLQVPRLGLSHLNYNP